MSKSVKDESKTPPKNENAEPELIPPNKENGPSGRVVQVSWQGPYPPPDVMKKYDDVVPNGAERLFKAFEDETKHRREMERMSLGFQGRDLVIGKILALLFTICVMVTIGFAIAYNSPWVAGILGAGMLTTIAIGFFRVYGDGEASKSAEDRSNKKSDSK